MPPSRCVPRRPVDRQRPSSPRRTRTKWVWSSSGRKQYDIVVEPAITTLEQHLQSLFPGENIAISVSEEAIVLSGQVSSTNVMLRAGEIARASASKSKIINLLQVPGGSESQQVMLQVRFAEVNRRRGESCGFLGRGGLSKSEEAPQRVQQLAQPQRLIE